MKKKNIFDLYAAQHKDEPEPNAERVPGEVKPEDVAPAPEVTPSPGTSPEPKQETPEPKQETPEPKQETKEGEDGNVME